MVPVIYVLQISPWPSIVIWVKYHNLPANETDLDRIPRIFISGSPVPESNRQLMQLSENPVPFYFQNLHGMYLQVNPQFTGTNISWPMLPLMLPATPGDLLLFITVNCTKTETNTLSAIAATRRIFCMFMHTCFGACRE